MRAVQMPPGAVWELHYKQWPAGKQWIKTGPHSTPKVTVGGLEANTHYVMKARGGYQPEGRGVADAEMFQFGVEARLKTHMRKVVPTTDGATPTPAAAESDNGSLPDPVAQKPAATKSAAAPESVRVLCTFLHPACMLHVCQLVWRRRRRQQRKQHTACCRRTRRRQHSTRVASG